jgi:hypothetical protein
MANRRMFSNRIANSARFLQMPVESQLLYFHMILRADDDGVVESYPLMKLLGSPPDSFKVLLAKNFIRQLNEDQVIVVVDWLEHNTIRADRKINSIYQGLLLDKCPDIEFIEPKPRSDVEDNSGRVGGLSTDSISKVRLGKVKLSKVNTEKPSKSREYLLSIPIEDLQEIAGISSATQDDILKKGFQLNDYCLSHGKKYKNYKAFLRNAVTKDFPPIKPSKWSGIKTIQIQQHENNTKI